MISHKIIIKNGKIQQEFKKTEDTPEQDVAFMIYCLQKTIKKLNDLEFEPDLEIRYGIDKDGNPIKDERK